VAALNQDFEFAALSEAKNYRAALIEEFRPFLHGCVLEVGAGVGQMSALLADRPEVNKVLAVEPEEKFVTVFQSISPKITLLHGTAKSVNSTQWNAIVSINVLEHIEKDAEELATYRELLAKERGHLCLFVPARPEIYAPIDADFGHFRRYRKSGLKTKLREAGFEIVRLNYFNFIGYFAWALNFHLLGKRSFNVNAVRLFDRRIFPVGHALEKTLFRPPIGQSLLAVARANA
jgi:SAM-dependent methyltransferase